MPSIATPFIAIQIRRVQPRALSLNHPQRGCGGEGRAPHRLARGCLAGVGYVVLLAALTLCPQPAEAGLIPDDGGCLLLDHLGQPGRSNHGAFPEFQVSRSNGDVEICKSRVRLLDAEGNAVPLAVEATLVQQYPGYHVRPKTALSIPGRYYLHVGAPGWCHTTRRLIITEAAPRLLSAYPTVRKNVDESPSLSLIMLKFSEALDSKVPLSTQGKAVQVWVNGALVHGPQFQLRATKFGDLYVGHDFAQPKTRSSGVVSLRLRIDPNLLKFASGAALTEVFDHTFEVHDPSGVTLDDGRPLGAEEDCAGGVGRGRVAPGCSASPVGGGASTSAAALLVWLAALVAFVARRRLVA